jgi:hypothetical protein
MKHREINLKKAVDVAFNVANPHPQPFPQRGKGVNPLSLWERARVRVKHYVACLR